MAADGRDFPAKPRPVDTKNASRRPRHSYIDITDIDITDIHTLRHRYRHADTDTQTDTFTDRHTYTHSQTYTQNDIGLT